MSRKASRVVERASSPPASCSRSSLSSCSSPLVRRSDGQPLLVDLGRDAARAAANLVDPLSITMCLFVTDLGADSPVLDRLHARGEDFRSSFLYLNLFVFSMLLLVLANNCTHLRRLEGVGPCSYWLVSYYFDRDSAARGIEGVHIQPRGRRRDVDRHVLAVLATAHVDLPHHLRALRHADADDRDPGRAGVAARRDGKSARSPLFNWLPDAMEGTTPGLGVDPRRDHGERPGVYLLVRIRRSRAVALGSMTIAVIGGVTASWPPPSPRPRRHQESAGPSPRSPRSATWCSPSAWAPTGRDLLDDRSRVLQSAAFLGSGFGHPFAQCEQDMRKMGGLQKYPTPHLPDVPDGWLAISGRGKSWRNASIADPRPRQAAVTFGASTASSTSRFPTASLRTAPRLYLTQKYRRFRSIARSAKAGTSRREIGEFIEILPP